MSAHGTPMRGLDAVGLAIGALLAAGCVPSTAAEFSERPGVATVGEPNLLCEPARWLGKGAPISRVAASDTGWWVVLATVPADQDVQGALQRLEGCGLHPFNDFSSKFNGFRPGFLVVVDGPYATRNEAEGVRSAASQCVPDAYVKWAHYLGE